MRRERPSSPTISDNPNIDSLIGEHSHFNGELKFEGAVRIDGKFEGNISSHSDGTLIISEQAVVIGEVDVPNLILHGTVRGNVRTAKNLKICSTGRLNGDVEYSLIALEEGGSINGRCNRIEDRERIKQAAKLNTTTASNAEQSPQPA